MATTGQGAVTELNSGKRRFESFIRRRKRAVAATVVFGLVAAGAWALSVALPVSAKAAISLDQCANLDAPCDETHPAQWQNGNLNANNSRYFEGDSVPYRAIMTGLTAGSTYAITMEWDSTESGKHAIDYLTSFDRTATAANPCAGLTCGTKNELTIPVDPNVAAAGVTEAADRKFTAYGATFPNAGQSVANTGDLCEAVTCTIATNPSTHVLDGTYSGNSKTSITVYVTATSETVVLAWGGHIAERRDWGVGKSAVALPGSPYHMRVVGLGCSDATNCDVGNQDRSLSSEAVVYAASITVVKEASVEGNTPFVFTASPAPLSGFTLIDDGSNTDTKTFSGITTFGTYSLSEQTGDGFRLASVDCTVVAPNGGTQALTTTGVLVDVREGEIVTCIFRNTIEGSKSIDLKKTADVTNFDEVGDVVTYTYLITNDGDTTLGPTQFTITDDRINGGIAFPCGGATTTLAVGGTVSCTKTYTIAASDVEAESVVNKATASGAGVTSPMRTVTVTLLVVPPTSTTTSTTSTTTSTTTSIPATSTTTPVTAASTTIPATTTPVTVAPTTTNPTDLQVLLAPTTTVPAESDFLVLFPDELPNTGPRFNLGFLVAGLALLAIGALIGFGNLRTNGSFRKKGRSKA